MPSDYNSIRADNERRYGTDIGRIGPMLLADRYDDRTHFIFELLQNAEDALARRKGWNSQRSVRFHLNNHELRVSHFGKPFDEDDVRGICGIAESTKDLTEIGRFGIGFKSVYAFTNRPEVHSGAEDFAIENFVWPIAVMPLARETNETIIIIPLNATDHADCENIADGLRVLGARALMFLREIEEIEWVVDNGPSGLYLRSQPENLSDGVRRVTVIGQEQDKGDSEESWLVFSKPVTTGEGISLGHVELAFSVMQDERTGRERVSAVTRSPLVVFFPTVLETHLGFLVQGPYRTTPSRDNIPRHDSWNLHCVHETADVLTGALRWLRDHDLYDTSVLRCLPLDREKFGESSMFAPLFDATKHTLATEPLLPRFGGGYAAAGSSRLARTQELRELFDPSKLGALFGAAEEITWLSGDISQDRTPELRRYLMQELDVSEITPEMVILRLDHMFFEAQSDDWIVKLYEFLNGQRGLRSRLDDLPLIRLEDGRHVPPRADGQTQAFLPGTVTTEFPTVRASVCATEMACEFLHLLGLTEPDPVDDIVRNILPKYREDDIDVSDVQYEVDIRRILTTFATDSKAQREKLIDALREATFVMAVDGGDGSKRISRPTDVYLATERLKDLFSGVEGILLVDDEYSCLRGEGVRELLEACGAVRYLRPIEDKSLSREEQRELRMQAGHAQTSGYSDRVTDRSLLGLKDLLIALQKADLDQRRIKAELLWEELAHLEERRGKGVYTGEYTWTHNGKYRVSFDAAFVRMLNTIEWVPDHDGNLQRPELVLFNSLGWKPNPFLQSKIWFKPPVLDQLAKEAGIELGVLDLLKKLGVTSEADLRVRLGVADDTAPKDDRADETVHDSPETTPSDTESTGPKPAPAGDEGPGTGRSSGLYPGGEHTQGKGAHSDSGRRERGEGPRQGGGRTHGSSGGRPFISYVAVHPDDEETDPDRLGQQARMALEAQAIDLILRHEPNWQRTPAFNPGYDLFKAGPNGQPNRWCEVKAMTGSLHGRPVGLSHTQFESAREHGADYWLYIVEHTGTDNARIVRIQDPAGKARTFTFDQGWIDVAQLDSLVD